ncbi:MAG: histidine kinase [Desulfobacterales bacterium SG8_35]|nr:MAG: histidine kinase [Desulfobacterales bacterium SG8_35]
MIEKILIVDDSPVSRKIMKSCIPEDKGYEMFEAGDGQSGIDKYQQLKPDLTFMDLTMPVMDGMQALQQIIKIDPKAVVVVCTADVQMKTIFKVMNLGALMVVRKPVSKQAIEDALRKAEDKLKVS